MEKYQQVGFTLIELLTTVAIASILLGVGIPSFTEAVKNSRISSQYNNVVQALYLARSEAVKNTSAVTVCARGSDTTCGSDWNNGWLVFVDNTLTANEAVAVVDATDQIINVQEPVKGDNTVESWGSDDRTAAAVSERSYVRYFSDGSTDWENGFFKICDTDRGAEFSRAVNIVLTGDIRRARSASTSTTPLDTFGRLIDCPVS